MLPDLLLLLADRLGVFVFALSGGVLAVRREMDLFGVIFLAFLPAIGGGTLRDMILDVPVFWLGDSWSLGIALAGGLSAFFFFDTINGFRPLRWADAVGLALFAATGAMKALALGHGFSVTVIMGLLTACAGGLLRDVTANEEPLLLKSEVYATAAILGAIICYGSSALDLPPTVSLLAGAFSAFLVRGIAIAFGLSLPKPRRGPPMA